MSRARTWMVLLCIPLLLLLAACNERPKPYGTEVRHALPAPTQQAWAVAPAVNLSGQRIDPLLQADHLYRELQSVRGIRAVPVNRVAEVYAALRIDGIQSIEQAQAVCELLGVDALVVPTVTIYDPYHPPRMAAALALFTRSGSVFTQRGELSAEQVRDFARAAREPQVTGLPSPQQAQFLQEVAIFDASHGSTRQRLDRYTSGRSDPNDPFDAPRYTRDMGRYSGFVYFELLGELMQSLAGGARVAGG